MATPIPLRLRLFLEGIEVPVVSASLAVSYDAPAACQIQIPATDKAQRFHARTLVHAFWFDPRDPSPLLRARTEDAEAVADVEQEPAPTPQPESSTEGVEAPWDLTQGPLQPDRASEQPSSEHVESPWDLTQGPCQPDLAQRAAPIHAEHSGAIRDMPTELALMGLPPELAEDPDTADRRWKTFFHGEIVGHQFVKSQGQRAVILQCLDESLYWDTCYQYQVNVASLHGNATADFVGAGTTLFDNFYSSPTATIVDVVNRPSVSRPELTGLLSGVVHLLERVGGVYTSRRGFKGVNDFFSIAELRLHLIDMIAASEDDTSSQRLFPARAFNAWTRSAGGRLGQIASFREILNQLNRFIYHNTVPCPIARYQPPGEFQRTRRVTSSRTQLFQDTTDGQEVLEGVAAAALSLARLRSRPISVQRNAMTPMLERLAVAVVRLKDRVALHMSDYGLQSVHSDLHRAGQSIRALASRVRQFESTWGDMTTPEIIVTTQVGTEVHALTYSAFVTEGDGRSDYDTADSLLESASQVLLAGTHTTTSSRDRTETISTHGRLYSQIIRPDIFMVAPPRCNVIFPELYTDLRFSRQYLREVTRLRLTVSDEIFGPNSLLDNIYFAPDVEVLGARVQQGRGSSMANATLSRAAYAGRLMDHELYTGVVPVFERLNEVNLVAGRSNQVAVRGVSVPYAARAANFQFFKGRWSSRSASVNGVYHPYIAPGFPALIVDRYMTQEQVRLADLRGNELLEAAHSRGWSGVRMERDQWPEAGMVVDENMELDEIWAALRETVPTQFLGLVAQVTHNVSQDGASSSYALTAARTHRDSEELLGANMIERRRAVAGSRTVLTTVAAPAGRPPQVGQIGPNRGTITSVNESDIYGGEYLLFGTFRTRAPRSSRVKVPVGVKQLVSAYDPEVARLIYGGILETSATYPQPESSRLPEQATHPSQFYLEFTAYDISESMEGVDDGPVRIPLEDILRPPWMSDVWTNERIGAVYQQFFGTGAITDSIVMQTDVGTMTDTSEHDEAAADAEATNTQTRDPIQADGTTRQDAGAQITVERAIDLLVKTYSALKHNGMDVLEFVRAYTERPIADLVDLLGSRDLIIDPQTGAAEGTEGLHSRAFGHGDMGRNLLNLVPPSDEEGRPPIRQLLGIDVRRDEGAEDNLSRLDKRAEKAERVMEYVEELWASRVLLG